MCAKLKSKSILHLIILIFISFQIYTGYYNNKEPSIPNISLSNQGWLNDNQHEIFWFFIVSDTQFIWYNNEKIEQFNRFLSESYKTIKPNFIYHTGDIVDADNGNQQHVEEWQRYNQLLFDNNMNASVYMDVMGNHDSVADPDNSYFLNYSMMGSTQGVLQYSFKRTFPFGDYAFIGVNTAKDEYSGVFDFGFLGYLDTQELNWYESELKKYVNCKGIFTFGHHPISYPPFNYLLSNSSSSGKDFFQLNELYNVKCYFAGHAHTNYQQEQNQTFSIITTNFDEGGGTYRIIAIDNNQISSSIEHVGNWPQGLITTPPRYNYPPASNVNSYQNIRILAWDPNDIFSVQWALFNSTDDSQLTNWKNMEKSNTNNQLWEDKFNFYLPGEYKLKTLIEGGSGTTMKEIIINIPLEPINQLSDITFLILIITIAFISISFSVFYSWQKRNFKKIRNSQKNKNHILSY